MIYFDNSATTAIAPSVLETYMMVSQEVMGNPSSLHTIGGEAYRLLDQSRKQIAELLGVEKQEVYFTSGGTEGDNWAIKGTAIEKMPYGKHLITSSIEHPAVLKSFAQLEKMGFEVTYLPVSKTGIVSLKALREAIKKETTLISIMAVNNETGSVQPIEQIGEILKEYPSIHFHVDAVQSIGRQNLQLGSGSRIDLAVFSAHKFHGPKGVGILYKKRGRRIAPLLNGGGQEYGQRSGTEDIAGIASTAKALRLLLENQKEKNQHVKQMQSSLRQYLSEKKLVTLFSSEEGAAHILCFGIKGIRGEVVVHALEKEGIYVSTTSACSSKRISESGTLNAMGYPQEVAQTAVRISLSSWNTMEEINSFKSKFSNIYTQFENLRK